MFPWLFSPPKNIMQGNAERNGVQNTANTGVLFFIAFNSCSRCDVMFFILRSGEYVFITPPPALLSTWARIRGRGRALYRSVSISCQRGKEVCFGVAAVYPSLSGSLE